MKHLSILSITAVLASLSFADVAQAQTDRPPEPFPPQGYGYDEKVPSEENLRRRFTPSDIGGVWINPKRADNPSKIEIFRGDVGNAIVD